MRDHTRQIILFTLTVVILLLAPSMPKTHAATLIPTTTAATTTTVLSNDPNSTDWTIDSPVWTLKNGLLDGSGVNGTLSPKIISSASFSSDRTVQLDFRTVTPGSQNQCTAWILGKYVDFYHKIIFLLFTTGLVQMVVWQGNTSNTYDANSALNPTAWHHATLIFSGNNAQAYVNGTSYMNVTDPGIGALGASNISLASWCNSESQFTNINVSGSVLADELPIANFYANPQPARAGQSVLFDGSPSYDPDGHITSYQWSFGDGLTGSGEFPSHTYNNPGNYTATLTVTDSGGQTSSAIHSITILPPPTLKLTPANGPVGTKVLVSGSGFQPLSPFYPTTVDVTFDDQFVGFTTLTNTTFNFVFDVPLAQPGLHQVNAYAQSYPSPTKATTDFFVTPTLAGPVMTISAGTVYFPGDTATIYVLSTLNGSPASVNTIHLTLLLPSGTTTSLSLASVSPGVYEASYMVPSTNSLGTYALVGSAQTNSGNATALGSFEVKPTWLQTNGRTVTTASGIVGAVGTVSFLGVAWKKGYLTKRKEEFTIS